MPFEPTFRPRTSTMHASAPKRLLIIADPTECPVVRTQVGELYPGAQVDCIDVGTVENDLLPRAEEEDWSTMYAAVILAIPGLDGQWREVLKTLRSKWSWKTLPIVMVGPQRLECEAMNRRQANGYIPSEKPLDPIQSRYFHHVLSALTALPS